MSAYNVVQCAAVCPKCGRGVQWQSKRLLYDGYLLANAMQQVALAENTDGEMHAVCQSCRLFLEATISKGQQGRIGAEALPTPAAIGTGLGK